MDLDLIPQSSPRTDAMSKPAPFNLAAAATSLPSLWHPHHLFTLNATTSFKVARLSGEFIWHAHPDTDEVFLVVSGGPLTLQLNRAGAIDEGGGDEGDEVRLHVGEMFCIPRGTRHRPVCEVETGVLLVEKIGTVNTGDESGSSEARGRTVNVDERRVQ